MLLSSFGLLSGCNLANHGSFHPQSYLAEDKGGEESRVSLGQVEGKSCQTSALYFIPLGEAASTDSAINDAKSKITGTEFLTDISIDDKLWVELGYSVQCILVNATAYGINTDVN